MKVIFSSKQDVAKPATDLAFPSVTICSPGLNMEAVEEAVYKDYQEWKKEEGNSGKEVVDFMAEIAKLIKFAQTYTYSVFTPFDFDLSSPSTIPELMAWGNVNLGHHHATREAREDIGLTACAKLQIGQFL